MESDVTKLIRDLERANRKHEDQISKLRQTVREAKRAGSAGQTAGRQFSTTFAKAGTDLRAFIGQFVGVQAAVGLVTGAYASWRAEMEKLAVAHEVFTSNLVRTLTETGDLAQAPRIERFIGSVPGATREQARTAFESVSGGDPAASLDRRLQITREVAPQAVTGVSLDDLGLVAGQLSKIAPEVRADDIVDIATNIRAQAGSEIRKVGSASFIRGVQALQSTGAATFDEAVGLALTALKADLRPDVLVSAAGKLSQPADTFKDPGLKEFADSTPRERLRQLLDDRDLSRQVLGADQAVRFNLIDHDLAAERTTQIVDAQRGDFARQQIASLRTFPSGAEVSVTQEQAVQTDVRQRLLELREAQAKRAEQEVRALVANRSGLTQFRARTEASFQRATGFHGGLFGVGDFAPDAPDLRGTAGSVIASAAFFNNITREQAAAFERREAATTQQIIQLERALSEAARAIRAASRELREQRRPSFTAPARAQSSRPQE